MSEFSEYFQKMFQLDSALGLLMLLVLFSFLGIAAYRLTYSKEVDNNGKVTLTRKQNLAFTRLLSTGETQNKKPKPFTRFQKRLLKLLYSAHEALFGLIIFAFGLGLITKVFVDLTDGTQRGFDPVLLTCTLLGILAMPVGVLLIYFRDADNPFDEN